LYKCTSVFWLESVHCVRALPLDDALLKCVGTEDLGLVFNCYFEDTDISQGRCGEIFTDNVITNFLLILIVKSLKICQNLINRSINQTIL